MRRALLTLTCAILCLPIARAALPLTAGYVDMQRVVAVSRMGREAEDQLQALVAERQREIAADEAELRRLREALTRDAAHWRASEREARSDDLRQRVDALMKKLSQVQREMQAEKERQGERILAPVKAIIATIARERGLSAVLERRQGGLLYVDEGLDLTDEVIRRLDAH